MCVSRQTGSPQWGRWTVVSSGGRSNGLILAAMIFAVSMTFIDQTIVSIAVPEIQQRCV